MKEGRMKAVHDADLESLLDSLGVLSEVLHGVRRCAFCGKVVTMDNIECIFPQDREVRFCCSSVECYRKLIEKSGDDGA